MEKEYNRLEETTQTETETLQQQIVIYRNKIESHKTEQQELMLKKIALKQNVFNSEKEFEFIIQRKKKFAQMKDMYVSHCICVFKMYPSCLRL